jgi:RHS repeat-associated protein
MRTYIACKLYDTNVSITKDTAGRLLTKQQTIGTTVLKATLTRDTLGRVSNILYPSGMNVAITYTADVVSAIAVNGTNLINTIVYRPFSNQPSSWRWGNGTTYTRNFDTDGRITSVTLGTATRSFAYDAVGRISGFSDTGTAGTKASAFTYDEADQLIGYSAPGTTQGFAYDTNGNRLSQTVTGTSATVSYLSGNYSLYSGTNRIASAPNQAVYAYNADGSPTDTLQYLLGYDAYGRLVTVDGNQIGDMVANYKYNGLGQRVVKSVIKPNINTGVNTVTDARQFFYDDSTQLLGEYATKGMPSQETVWFNGQPVATVRAGILYYINADHLATPRSIVRASDNLEVWRWDSDPFGTNNPVLSTAVYFPYNLRFPGQYKDTETGLHYNGMRDYDPRTGRYLQADPIGLAGGKNRYGYVKANPTQYSDPTGQETNVTCWSPSGGFWSRWGHITTSINGVNYSFGPQGWDTRLSSSDYTARQFSPDVNRTGAYVVNLNLTAAQEAQLESCLKNPQGSYGGVSNNCGRPVQNCLELLGVLAQGDNTNIYPVDVIRNILGSSAASGSFTIGTPGERCTP